MHDIAIPTDYLENLPRSFSNYAVVECGLAVYLLRNTDMVQNGILAASFLRT